MKTLKATGRGAAMLLMSGALAAPAAFAASEPRVGRNSDTYGTASTTDYVLQAFEFQPYSGAGTSLAGTSVGSRYCSGGSACILAASAMLPAGALIANIELEACDSSSTGQWSAALYQMGPLESSNTQLAGVTTGVAATPGCNFFEATLATPHTVDNHNNTYIVVVDTPAGSSGLRLQAVRILYRLQVSPAPATATFPNDVPTTHPLFRFVEALAAAGISGGCGTGSFCPDAPLTRGQMAVFLSTALGLHFPN